LRIKRGSSLFIDLIFKELTGRNELRKEEEMRSHDKNTVSEREIKRIVKFGK